MSIENLLTSLKESIDRNTEALLKAGSATQSASAATADKPAATEKTTKPKAEKAATKEEAPKVTQEQVQAALIKIKDDFGMPHAKEIIKDVGEVDKMGDIKPAKYQAVFDAAVKKHAELTAAANGEGGESDDGL